MKLLSKILFLSPASVADNACASVAAQPLTHAEAEMLRTSSPAAKTRTRSCVRNDPHNEGGRSQRKHFRADLHGEPVRRSYYLQMILRKRAGKALCRPMAPPE